MLTFSSPLTIKAPLTYGTQHKPVSVSTFSTHQQPVS